MILCASRAPPCSRKISKQDARWRANERTNANQWLTGILLVVREKESQGFHDHEAELLFLLIHIVSWIFNRNDRGVDFHERRCPTVWILNGFFEQCGKVVQTADENFDETQFTQGIFDDVIVFQDVNEVFHAILMIWNRAERETKCL